VRNVSSKRSISYTRTEAQISRRSSLFRGLSRMSRDIIEQTFRVTFGVKLRRAGDRGLVPFGCDVDRESPRKCALSADENINFSERSTMRYGESAHAYGDLPSPLSVVCCGLDRKINARRPSTIRFIGHITHAHIKIYHSLSLSLCLCKETQSVFEFLKF
jgi:hypothetical protein